MIAVNPIPSLRLVGVRAKLGVHTLRIPPLPAAVWLEKLYSGGVGDVLELCEGSEAIEDEIAEGRIPDGDLDKTLKSMIGAAAGRDPMVALRLAALARGAWQRIGGELTRSGARLDSMPLGAFLDAVYAIVVRNMSAEELGDFEARLLGPAAPTSRGRGRPAPSPVPASAAPYVMTRTKTRTRPLQPRPADPTPTPIPLPVEPARNAPEATSERPAVTGWPAYERASRPRPKPPTPRVR